MAGGVLTTLSVKAGAPLTENRESDLRRIVFGGRGMEYDELQYLRQQNGDADGVNDKLIDAWHKFATGQGVVSSRSEQEIDDFYEQKTFP